MISPPHLLGDLIGRAAGETMSLKACFDVGLLRVDPPWVLARGAAGLAKYGAMGGAIGLSAARYPDRVAVRDELGALTYREVDQRSNALANAWRERGLEPGGGVAILARNHRGFLDAAFAAMKCGARIVL